MNFTREPIIETIITPKEGCKLVVRNSKGSGQEEFFVDALEVISFGPALFFRSLERPKCFLVPVSDYEIMEVRETRMVLKATPMEKGIKIGGGKDAPVKTPKEVPLEKELPEILSEEPEGEDSVREKGPHALGPSEQQRFDKKRDRRRHRRRRGKGDEKEPYPEEIEEKNYLAPNEEGFLPPPTETVGEKVLYTNHYKSEGQQEMTPSLASPFAALLPPPKTLISETLALYRGNAEYKKAFFHEPEEADSLAASEMPIEMFNDEKIAPQEEPPPSAEASPQEEEFANPYLPDDDYIVLPELESEEETYEDPRKDP